MTPPMPRLSRSALGLALATMGTVLACETTLDLGRNERERDEEPSDSTTDAGLAKGDAGSDDSSCATVCARLDACGALTDADRASCMSTCFAETTKALRDCIVRTPCSEMVEACRVDGGGFETEPNDDFEIMVCQDHCDGANLQQCLTAAEHADCRELCAGSSAAARETFVTCFETSAGRCESVEDCYGQFSR